MVFCYIPVHSNNIHVTHLMLLRSACKVDSAKEAMTKVEKGTDIGLEILIEEIDDFIDENPVNSKTPLSTLESNIKRAEDMRFSIRLRNREEGYDSTDNSYVTFMNNIKSYIKQSKQATSDSQTKEEVKQTDTLQRLRRQRTLFLTDSFKAQKSTFFKTYCGESNADTPIVKTK